ncbi:MAG: ABC transporter ATP-binding protein [Chloroflexota bacterium]
MLRLCDVHTYYSECCVLQGVSLKLEEGSVVALLGRNGMGKTTTIRSIIGAAPPRQGTVHLRGQDITGLPPYRIAQAGVGLVPQGRRIFPSLTVEENLTMAARSRGKTDAWTLDTVYSHFPALKRRAKLGGSRLSGGEQQMLAIARALMTSPELVLMDEPSEGLAPIAVQEITEIIRQLKTKGLSILLVEQNLPMALALADYVYVISKGKIVFESTPKELQANEEVKAKWLGVER